MIQLINKLKKNQKGFTLVELIVVLVILAILAAFTIPAMLGFIEDAKGKAYVAQAREVYLAGQTVATEKVVAKDTKIESSGDGPLATAVQDKLQKDIPDSATWTITVGENSTIAKVVYKDGGYTVTIDETVSGGSAVITKDKK